MARNKRNCNTKKDNIEMSGTVNVIFQHKLDFNMRISVTTSGPSFIAFHCLSLHFIAFHCVSLLPSARPFFPAYPGSSAIGPCHQFPLVCSFFFSFFFFFFFLIFCPSSWLVCDVLSARCYSHSTIMKNSSFQVFGLTFGQCICMEMMLDRLSFV